MKNENLKWINHSKTLNWQELSNLYKILELGNGEDYHAAASASRCHT